MLRETICNNDGHRQAELKGSYISNNTTGEFLNVYRIVYVHRFITRGGDVYVN